MPKIKLEHIVSCSSEDPDHVANNLLNNETKKKWKNKSVGESSASVIFQLEKSSKISGIDIGNENSSFVEVLVGRSSSQEQDYKIILAMSSFMTPMEARNLSNNNRVRMFTYNDLSSSVRDEKWDRVKVVCTQPFNKHVQFGLSFITLNTPQVQNPEETSTVIGKFTIRPESPNVLTAGSLFAKRKEFSEENNSDSIITVAQAIKTSDKPKCKPVNIQSSASNSSKNSKTSSSNEAEVKNRNRKALFYDSDEEAENERIDKVIENAKAEEEKKKIETKTPKKVTAKKKNDDIKNSPKANSSTKKDKDTANDSPSTSKRKIDTTPKIVNKKRKVISKPFNELLRGVVFTISGIVNPERANLRTLALSMGATYRPDWDKTCTHLMCAFANTPKFNQVRGKGKIITKSWIKDCFDQRKRLPWRRYALDRNDQGKPESEDEIEELDDDSEKSNSPVHLVNNKDNTNSKQQNQLSNPTDYLSGSDTDDEIEKILAKQKTKATNNANNSNQDDPKTQSNDNAINSSKDDAFNIDTEEEEFKKNPADIEEIPKIFKSEIFYIDNVFEDDERNKIERLIKGFDGVVLTTLRNIVDFVITNEDSVEAVKEKCSSAKCVNHMWLYECHDILKRIPYEKFLLDSM